MARWEAERRAAPEGRGRGLGERGRGFCPSEPPSRGPLRAHLLGPGQAQRLVWQGEVPNCSQALPAPVPFVGQGWLGWTENSNSGPSGRSGVLAPGAAAVVTMRTTGRSWFRADLDGVCAEGASGQPGGCGTQFADLSPSSAVSLPADRAAAGRDRTGAVTAERPLCPLTSSHTALLPARLPGPPF